VNFILELKALDHRLGGLLYFIRGADPDVSTALVESLTLARERIRSVVAAVQAKQLKAAREDAKRELE
jgi:hypothetical protein